jgi:hypothetical protein
LQQRFFVSHASQDAALANRVVSYIEIKGAVCWIAPRDIPARSIYAEEITRAIRTSSACIVLVSSAASTSPAVIRELELASHYSKPFIPLRIDSSELSPSLEYYLRSSQWIQLDANHLSALDRVFGVTVYEPPEPPDPVGDWKPAIGRMSPLTFYDDGTFCYTGVYSGDTAGWTLLSGGELVWSFTSGSYCIAKQSADILEGTFHPKNGRSEPLKYIRIARAPTDKWRPIC